MEEAVVPNVEEAVVPVVKQEETTSDFEESEEDDDEDEDGFEHIKFEGLPYLLDKEDKEVVIPDDYSIIGFWNSEKNIVDFNDEGEALHKERLANSK